VAHDPVGVVRVDGQHVDPAAVPDDVADVSDQGRVGPDRVEHVHLEVRLDQHGGEPVGVGCPGDIAVQQGLASAERFLPVLVVGAAVGCAALRLPLPGQGAL